MSNKIHKILTFNVLVKIIILPHITLRSYGVFIRTKFGIETYCNKSNSR